ncbi:MAG: energy transducer TonB, partial [Candidatus Binatia bacterium]
MRFSLLWFACVLWLLCSHTVIRAQNISFNYRFSFEATVFNRPPQMGSIDITFPETARKNGVEGTVKANFTLGEDAKVRNIVIVQDLPFGVGEAVKQGLEKFSFKPAASDGKPVAMDAHLDYVVTLAYSEDDKDVTKPQFTDKPAPEYPESQKAANVKGKVLVTVMFYSDGTLKVIGTSSVMPQEFDKAAAAAAASNVDLNGFRS